MNVKHPILDRALLVVNPAAGGGTLDLAREAEERSRRHVAEVRVAHTSSEEEAVDATADAVRSGSVELVVAIGGDGTARGVAEGLARGLGHWPVGAGEDIGARLFIVPAGSGNSVYHALWGDLGWRDALEQALAGGQGAGTRSLDLIRIVESDHGALLGVNAGLIAHIARIIERMKAEAQAASGGDSGATAEESEGESGEQRYWTAIGQALEESRSFAARVIADGELLHEGTASMVTVGGVRRFGRGNFHVLPRSVLDDGLLDVCVVAPSDDEQLAELTQLVPLGNHLEHPAVAYAQCRRVTIESANESPLSIEHDGDPRPAGTRMELEVVPGAVPTFAAPAGGWG